LQPAAGGGRQEAGRGVVAAVLLLISVSLQLGACTSTPPTDSSAATPHSSATSNQSVPSTAADLPKEILGVWRNSSASPNIVFVQIFYSDGTVRVIDNVTTLMNPDTFTSDKYHLQGDRLVIDQTPDQGDGCTITTTLHRIADGTLELDPPDPDRALRRARLGGTDTNPALTSLRRRSVPPCTNRRPGRRPFRLHPTARTVAGTRHRRAIRV
jgi:hypothetical protein